MNAKTRLQIERLMSNPSEYLLKKVPFYRKITDSGGDYVGDSINRGTVSLTGTVAAKLPSARKEIIPQGQFLEELDVYSHRVLTDGSIPYITMKIEKDGYQVLEQFRLAIPFQRLILNKQVRHLCVNRIVHTLTITNPTPKQESNFVRFKQLWDDKNMEGAKTKMVKAQKSVGDAGLLFMMTDDGHLAYKNISFEDGYVIITHKDDMGKHILECLYYEVTDYEGNVTTYIDCYDDEYMTRFTSTADAGGALTNSGWVRHESVRHGFSENPLITKRGDVAWNNGQSQIEAYEALYNTVLAIYRKFGRGIIYVKGKFNQNGKTIATNVVLNDTSMDEHADAKVLELPEPQQAIDMLKYIDRTIQISTGTTYIMPDDIKISGDTSGLAVELTQELDMATAQDGIIEWQNVANKMTRLFKEGISKELVRHGGEEYSMAITEFAELRITSKFSPWKPKSEVAENQMLTALYAAGSGGISRQTFVEKNTVSAPDEMARIKKEMEEQQKREQQMAEQTAELEIKKAKETAATKTTTSNTSK